MLLAGRSPSPPDMMIEPLKSWRPVPSAEPMERTLADEPVARKPWEPVSQQHVAGVSAPWEVKYPSEPVSAPIPPPWEEPVTMRPVEQTRTPAPWEPVSMKQVDKAATAPAWKPRWEPPTTDQLAREMPQHRAEPTFKTSRSEKILESNLQYRQSYDHEVAPPVHAEEVSLMFKLETALRVQTSANLIDRKYILKYQRIGQTLIMTP